MRRAVMKMAGCKSLLLPIVFGLCAVIPAAPGATKSPHGIFDLLRGKGERMGENMPCWRNPVINGVRWRGGWNRVQRTVDGAYDWSEPDAAVTLAQQYNKQIGISF